MSKYSFNDQILATDPFLFRLLQKYFGVTSKKKAGLITIVLTIVLIIIAIALYPSAPVIEEIDPAVLYEMENNM